MRITPILLALGSLTLTESVPAATSGKIPGTVTVVDDNGNRVAAEDAWVYLQPVASSSHHRSLGSGVTATITQSGKEFRPHSVVVPKAATVEFPNTDDTDHNVFSPNPFFDLGLYAPSKDRHPKVFEDLGEHAIYCDRHRQMWAAVKVVDTTFIAHVDIKTGAYQLGELPDGDYKVVAWVPFSHEVRSEVLTIHDGNTTTAEELHLHQDAPPSHKRKDGGDYPCPPYCH